MMRKFKLVSLHYSDYDITTKYFETLMRENCPTKALLKGSPWYILFPFFI